MGACGEPGVRIATWNVNSLRIRLDQVLAWLAEESPDVLCLQETKVSDDLFPWQPIEALGYRAVFSGQKAYNGVAILSRLPLDDLRIGFEGLLSGDAQAEGLADQKRVISALIDGVRVVNLYGRLAEIPEVRLQAGMAGLPAKGPGGPQVPRGSAGGGR